MTQVRDEAKNVYSIFMWESEVQHIGIQMRRIDARAHEHVVQETLKLNRRIDKQFETDRALF